MSQTIDSRIVEMQFDNKDFDSNIQDSVKSLDKLKKSLNLEESAKGFTELDKSIQKMDFSILSKAAEKVADSFSLTGRLVNKVFDGIVSTIYNSMNQAKQFIESLTIEPISTGRAEYETQINAIQTIMSNTRDKMVKEGLSDAERLDIVNEKLDQLNTYADKTIYNFTEMTRNIGTFTAAGVDLNTAVSSIQGIANLAAVSGANSEKASRAMYQLSQAISTGTVKLIDWNSVVNADIGGEIFQKSLIRTANAMGVRAEVIETTVDASGKKIKKAVKKTVDELIKDKGSFRESLSEGWLTADVLTATLEQFSWDFEEMAKNTVLNNENRETFIQQLADSFIGQGEEADEALAHAKEVIGDTLELSAEAMKELKRGQLLAQGYTIQEAEDIIQLAIDASKAATEVKTFTQLIGTLQEAAQSGWTQSWEYIIGDFDEARAMLTGISDFFGNIIGQSAETRNVLLKEWHENGGYDMIWNNDATKGALGSFWNLTYGIKNLIDMIKEEFQKIFPPATSKTLLDITQKIQSATNGFKNWTESSENMDRLRRIVSGIASALDAVKMGVEYVWNGFKKLIGLSGPALDNILEFAAGIGDWLSQAKDSIKISEGFQLFLTRLGAAAESVKKIFVDAFKSVTSWFTKLWNNLKNTEIFSKIGTGISEFVGKIPDAITKIRSFAEELYEYVKSTGVIQTYWNNIKNFFDPIINTIVDFAKRCKDAISEFFTTNASSGASFGEKIAEWFSNIRTKVTEAWENTKAFLSDFFTNTVPNFFGSFDLNGSSIVDNIKSIDWSKILEAAFSITAIIKLIQTIRNANKAVSFLSSAKKMVKNFSSILKSIKKYGGTISLKGITANGKNPLSESLLKIAESIGILVASLYVLSKLDSEEVWKGLGFLTILAGELLAVSLLFNKIDMDGGSILKMVISILLLLIPIKLLNAMGLGELGKGLLSLGAILGELALFSRLMDNDFKGKDTGFIRLAIGINLMVIAIKSLAKMNFLKMVKGLGGMEVLLLELSSFSKKVSGTKVTGLIAMSIAIGLMAFSVKSLGELDFETLAEGVGGIGAVMLILGNVIGKASNMTFGKSISSLLVIVGSIASFIIAFKQLENANMEDLLSFGLSMYLFFNSMSRMVKVIGSMPITGALVGVLNLAIIIAGIGGIMVGLGYLQTQWSGLEGFLEIGGKMLGLIGQGINQFIAGALGWKGLPQIGTDLSDFMTNAQGFVEGVKNVDSSTAEGVGNLAHCLISIAGAEIVTAFASLFNLFKNPIDKFCEDIVKLGAGLSLYALAIAPTALVSDDTLNRSVAVAQALSDVASKIPPNGPVAQFLSGVGDVSKFAEQLPGLGEGITAFAKEVSSISADDYDEKKIDDMIAVANGLAKLESGVQAHDGFFPEKLFVGDKSLTRFSSGFEPFATNLGLFITDIKQIEYDAGTDGAKIDSLLAIAQRMANLESGLQGQDGFFPKKLFVGDKSLSKFSEGFEPFAQNLNKFVDDVKLIDYDDSEDGPKFTALLDIATQLSTLEKGLESQGGWEDAFVGVQSLYIFGQELPEFAIGLNSFITQARNIDYDPETDGDKLAGVIDVAKSLSDFEKNLEGQGGLWDLLAGHQDIGIFAGNIKSLGEAIASYIGNIKGVSVDDTTESLSAVEAIKKFVEALDPSGGVWNDLSDFFNGSKWNSLQTYVDSMKQLGEGLGTFSDGMKKVDVDQIDNAKKVVEAVQSFVSGFESVGSISKWLSDTFGSGNPFETLTDIAGYMASFGTNFQIFTDGIAAATTASVNFEAAKGMLEYFRTYSGETVSYDNVTELLGVVEECGSSLQILSDNLGGLSLEALSVASSTMEGIATAVEIANSLPSLSVDPIQTLLDNFATIIIPEFDVEGANTAEAYFTSLSNGLSSDVAKTSIENAIIDLTNAAIEEANKRYKDWEDVGSYLASGIEAGIWSMADSINHAAISVASQAIHAISVTWRVNSPSKVGRDLGMYFDLGIAGGLDGYSKVVNSSAVDMSQSVVDSASTLLRGVNGSIFDNIDPNPTIRPVVDLTNVQNGINAMNGMFSANGTQPIDILRGSSLSRGVSQLNLEGGRIRGTFTDSNIVSNLERLQTKMEDLGTAVTNMKLVLDTGTLVGETSARMDNELGTLAMRRGRGN